MYIVLHASKTTLSQRAPKGNEEQHNVTYDTHAHTACEPGYNGSPAHMDVTPANSSNASFSHQALVFKDNPRYL